MMVGTKLKSVASGSSMTPVQLRRLMPGAPAEDQDDEIARGLYPSGGRSGTRTDPECPQPACADPPAAQLAQPGRYEGPR